MRCSAILSSSAILLLAACGGSSGNDSPAFSTVPISASGFAGEENGDETVTLAQLTNQSRIIRDENGVTSFDRQDLALRSDTENQTFQVTLDGQTYDLELDTSQGVALVFEDGADFIEVQLFASRDNSNAFELFSVIDGVTNAGYFVIGADTSPLDVAAQSSQATFNGVLDVALRRDDFNDAFGSGDFELVANFDSNTIGGTATITDDTTDNADFTFDPITLTLENTAIEENGFAGDISIAEGDINGALVSADYEGRFFSEDATVVGGALSAQIDVDDSDTDTFVNGYFLGNR
jgi:hypothetical protein